MRFRKKKEPTENNQTLLSASPSTATESPVEIVKTVKKPETSIENHIYDIERAIDHQNYSLAQSMLERLHEGQTHNPRLSALKVRLYHKTHQIEQRDAYVRKRHDDLNEMQWRVFCDRIPSNVWQSLVAAKVVSGLSYDDDMNERVKDVDDTVIRNHPHLIVDNEDSKRQFESIEDIGFDGIPINSADEVTTLETPSESLTHADDLSFLEHLEEDDEPLDFFTESIEEAMATESENASKEIAMDDGLDDVSFLDLNDGGNTAIESDVVESDMDGIIPDFSMTSMPDERIEVETTDEELLSFEFQDEFDDSKASIQEKESPREEHQTV